MRYYKEPYFKERFSRLAIIAFALGILSLLCFPLYRIHIAFMALVILLGSGAIVTGIFAMRRINVYPLRGYTFAWIGVITGANGVAWLIINIIFSLIG